MKVYFVRHGVSIHTEAKHQLPDTPLSDTGKRQAMAIANRFSTINIDCILTSTYARALDTAKEIEKTTGVPIIQSDLFVERRMPTSFGGRAVDDPEIVPIHNKMRENFDVAGWHHEDEENLTDLTMRVRGALELIIAQNKENIVVVTHGYFLTVLIYAMLFGEDIELKHLRSYQDHTKLSNAGLTLCEYSAGKWKLLTWNDYAHLGE